MAAIGAGGMGEVYRAKDTNLGREVAIKVLSPEVVNDADRLARFKREAQLLAALNHPHIAAIYGLEEADGQPFLALELVEGEDLKQRLARGAIPVDESLEIAVQIAEALEEAHNKGIVHRDLKPANVKLTADGRVKVLDFGLAKAWAGDGARANPSDPALSESPTRTSEGTHAGLILGTASYMAPEQARGRPVDKRADVWSYGVLLWEMLTGRQLFTGETATDVIAQVVTREPDLEALPPGTPATVRRLIARSLRKDPRTRLPDIGAARLELQDLRSGPASGAETHTIGAGADRATSATVGSRWRSLGFLAVAAALGGLVALLLTERRAAPTPPRPPVHFEVELPKDVVPNDFDPPVLSPDGQKLAFVAASAADNVRRIWLRPMDTTELRPLAGTEGASAPIWSPDGSALAFAADGEIRKLALAGGSVLRVCALPRAGVAGGTWDESGAIIFASGGPTASLFRVAAAGGEPTALTTLDTARGEIAHRWPQLLPGGRQLLVTITGTQVDNSGVFVIPMDAPTERRRVSPAPIRTVYASGRLLAVRTGVLMAQSFDPARLAAANGDATPAATNVAMWPNSAVFGRFTASANGRLAWFPARNRDVRLAWFDRQGRPLGTIGEPARYSQLALSPDGRRVAVELQNAEGSYDLWLVDVARGISSRFAGDLASERDPVWSPDGSRLVYASLSANNEDILMKELSGGQPAGPLPGRAGVPRTGRDLPEHWSGATNDLLYMSVGNERTSWAIRMDGKSAPERVTIRGSYLDEPHVSPDGRWLAYVSTESGRFEVYVEPYRRRGEPQRVSASGGGQPRWRADGKELFFLSLDASIMAVSVRAEGETLDLGVPATLAAASQTRAIVQAPDYDDWDVSADGQRFLVKQPAGPDEPAKIHVLVDWAPAEGS